MPNMNNYELLFIFRLNSSITVETFESPFSCENGLDLVIGFDVIVDCSDNVNTRYLVNDACVLMKKPLVSGSAVRLEGHLTIFNLDSDTPCYRCLFPEPPPLETVSNCSDSGVLGVVPGIIGCLQALEVQKILMGKKTHEEILSRRMLFFNGLTCTFRNVNLRSKLDDCRICGKHPTILTLKDTIIDYYQCINKNSQLKSSSTEIIPLENRVSAQKYKKIMDNDDDVDSINVVCDNAGIITQKDYKNQNRRHILLDVRPEIQYQICNLPGSLSISVRKKLPEFICIVYFFLSEDSSSSCSSKIFSIFFF